MVRVVLFYMLVFTLSFHVFGQQEFVDLEIHPKNVEIGQSISITLKTNVKGHLDMDMPEEFIQSGAVQSGMSSSIKYINGQQKVVQYNFQSFTGYFEEAGTFIIGPATVSNKKQKYQSESHQIKVSQRQNMISDDPSKNLNQIIFGIIQQSRKEIYEGESIVVEGKVYSQVEILQVDDFTPFTMEVASENHALTNSNQVSSAYEVLNGKNVQTFKIGKSLIFPEKVGKHTIQPFQTTIVYNDWRKIFPERIKVVSNASEILVKPLPEGMPKHFINAVGEFQLTSHIAETKINQGKVIELKVKIAGVGNLHNINIPQINLPWGLSFYGDPEINDSIAFTSRGAKGSKTYTYFIQVNRSGNIHFNPIKIAYFNPESETYETIECKISSLNVKSNGQDLPEILKEEEQEVKAPTMQPYLTHFTQGGTSSIDIFKGWNGTLLLCSPIMLGFVLGIFIRAKNKSAENRLAKKLRNQHKNDALAQLDLLSQNNNNDSKANKLTKILIEFLSVQLNVHHGDVTRNLLKSKMPSEISEETYHRLSHLLDELDALKFSGRMMSEDINSLISEAQHIINLFE